MATKKKPKGEKVFVYLDTDHRDVELFDNLADAKKHAETNWPHEDEGWDNDKKGGKYHLGKYVTIFERYLARTTKVGS